ncbi:uncharacterized protein LOC121232589 [Aquila chrysaetos chrysaetos]|uniref:uncharacterized protein LOC121232589 n=1 Tax=Aquila chrysaetos chrysaetos TaxID=223781 RepID=UPI001B7D398A|nr:uncharacterized protein LOC121232589 [Aquila chrysaetos chrysaetos]
MRAGALRKRSPLPPCDQCSVLQLGGCECAGLPLSCTCRPSVTAMRHRGAVPPRSLLPPGKETPMPPQARGVGGRSARKARNCGAGAAPGHAPPAVRSLLLPPRGRSAEPQRRHRTEATLWVQLSVRPLGIPLTAAASGLRGLSLAGLPLCAAREHRGTGRALTGYGQELLRLKLERPEKVRSRSDGQGAPQRPYAAPTVRYGHVVSERASEATCLGGLIS